MLRRFVEHLCQSGPRQILASIFAIIAIGAALPARADDKLTVRLSWTAYAQHLPLFLAMEKGWFKAAHLDVYIEPGNGSITTVQLVGNGKFDLGHAALSSMAVGAAKGLNVIALAEYLQKSPLGIIYSKDLPIKSLKDFEGKSIIYTPASFESPFLEPFFRGNGVAPSSLKLIGVQASAKISTYLAGKGDAFVTTVPSDMPHVADKRPSSSLLFADYGMNLPTDGLIANTDSLKTKGPAIKRFVSVVSAAWAYILNGHVHEAAVDTIKQRPDDGTTVALLESELNEQISLFGTEGKTTFPGLQSEDEWAKAIKLMEEAKIIPAGTHPDQYFTNAYNDPAYGNSIVAGK
jgi:NitT/TauT family transport system substrate-binding protein